MFLNILLLYFRTYILLPISFQIIKQLRRSISISVSFPCGKESACNAGDLGSVPGLGRSPGKGNGYQLQYSSILAWRSTWTVQSMGSKRIGHDSATFTSLMPYLMIYVLVGNVIIIETLFTLFTNASLAHVTSVQYVS